MTRACLGRRQTTKVMVFFSPHDFLFFLSRCRSDCVADRSFKTALHACAVPVDYKATFLASCTQGLQC